MNTVIVGLGAVGSVYATALQDKGLHFRVALDENRLERYKSAAIVFNGQERKFDYFTPDDASAAVDLIIIATKWNGFADALRLIRPIVAPHTIILPLLNGISSEEAAIKACPNARVLYGYFIGHTATRNGRSSWQDGKYLTVFGNAHNDLNNLSDDVSKVKNLFDTAGVKYRIDEDMIASMWQKFIINIGLNQATAIYGQPYGLVRENEEALQFTRDLMIEAAAVGAKIGVDGVDKMVEKGLDTLAKMRPQDSSSMLQDVQAGRPTEVDIFAGEVCRLGRMYGVETPINQTVLDRMK